MCSRSFLWLCALCARICTDHELLLIVYMSLPSFHIRMMWLEQALHTVRWQAKEQMIRSTSVYHSPSGARVNEGLSREGGVGMILIRAFEKGRWETCWFGVIETLIYLPRSLYDIRLKSEWNMYGTLSDCKIDNNNNNKYIHNYTRYLVCHY